MVGWEAGADELWEELVYWDDLHEDLTNELDAEIEGLWADYDEAREELDAVYDEEREAIIDSDMAPAAKEAALGDLEEWYDDEVFALETDYDDWAADLEEEYLSDFEEIEEIMDELRDEIEAVEECIEDDWDEDEDDEDDEGDWVDDEDDWVDDEDEDCSEAAYDELWEELVYWDDLHDDVRTERDAEVEGLWADYDEALEELDALYDEEREAIIESDLAPPVKEEALVGLEEWYEEEASALETDYDDLAANLLEEYGEELEEIEETMDEIREELEVMEDCLEG